MLKSFPVLFHSKNKIQYNSENTALHINKYDDGLTFTAIFHKINTELDNEQQIP